MSHNIRRMHTIYPFGVGAVKEIAGESFVACDISRWSDAGIPLLGVDRLLRNFRLTELRMADSSESATGIPYYRFPEWHFCEDRACRCLRQMSFDEQEAGPKCSGRPGVSHKSRQMKPVRYVQVCTNGHMQEVDWAYWVHLRQNSEACRSRSEIRMDFDRESNKTIISCGSCGARRVVEDLILQREANQMKCQGRHPWEVVAKGGDCDLYVSVSLRGAGNIWFPHSESGIVIPPDSDYSSKKDLLARLFEDNSYKQLAAGPNSPMAAGQRRLLKGRYNITDADIDECLRAGQRTAEPDSDTLADTYEEEWVALTDNQPTPDVRSDFVIEPVDKDSIEFVGTSFTSVPEWLSSVTMVQRLREIRVLHGFTRVYPLSTSVSGDIGERGSAKLVPAGLQGETWRPAVEVFGEGVFITLSEQMVQRWEARTEVLKQVSTIRNAASEHIMAGRLLPRVSARYLLLHSFAHALIREISFDCGYPLAALNERIYSTRDVVDGLPMCGVLIYTADADSEGSMGGLVAQAKPDRVMGLLERAIASTTWCSLDPVCSETISSGGLNSSVCHACGLLPENSCELSNLILDRQFVSPDSPVSFFEGVM